MSEHESSAPDTDVQESGISGFLTHLVELRNRLLKSVLVVLLLFLALFPFRNELFTLLADPLSRHMPAGTTMIAVQVAAPFFIPLKLTALTAVFIAIPFLLYQLWAFIAPGLYKHERKMVAPLVFSSTILFYLGACFAYFVVFPIVFGFLSTAGPADVNFAPDIGEYLSFVTSLFFAFGFVFEVPVAIVLLVIVGVVTPDKLAEFRRYAILSAFIIGAILTPPDVLSQFMMAVPIWLLYELGIIVGRIVLKTRKANEEDATEPEAPTDPEDDQATTERHQRYELEAVDTVDLDKAFDEAEAEQRQLDEPKKDDESGQPPEDSASSSPVNDAPETGTTPDSTPPPAETPPKKPGDPA
ncbi:twin-arginine translocase subunit TatC [Halothiobacillus sp.]|uniref:twin-arginine translocase subunit TatC n=1 Tax=Halothiobacillus sp. TaxID=1891311 RepID=UPI002AD2B632|nr:twin-arginine translocase subunit TatC [Halothiobacillus sp.]